MECVYVSIIGCHYGMCVCVNYRKSRWNVCMCQLKDVSMECVYVKNIGSLDGMCVCVNYRMSLWNVCMCKL